MKFNYLYKFASSFYVLASTYEQFKDKIEETAKRNKKPFSNWFGGEDRVYLPYNSESNFDSAT